MKIAVNTRHLLSDYMEGIPRFIYETTKRIVALNPQHEFHFLFDRPYDKQFIFSDNVIPHVISPPAKHPILWYLWFEHRLPSFFKKNNIDAFLSGDMYLSLKTKTPTFYVSHDLAFLHYPEHLPYLTQKYYNHYSPKYHQRAKKIFAVSEATKTDIVESYNIPEEKVLVSYNSAPEGFKPVDQKTKENIQAKYADSMPYFVYIGSVHPRKNVDNLVKAFNEFKKLDTQGYKLLIAGRMAWKNNSLKQLIQYLPSKADIIFPNDFQGDLKAIMASSEALVYVSSFEGFGIPILEAFHAEVPVITSNLSSMPEVAGEAALLVDPFDPKDIAKAMKMIASDKRLSQSLVEKGRQRKKDFSWDKSAKIISDELNTFAASINV